MKKLAGAAAKAAAIKVALANAEPKSGMRFNPYVRLDTSQVEDRRPKIDTRRRADATVEDQLPNFIREHGPLGSSTANAARSAKAMATAVSVGRQGRLAGKR